VQGLRRTAIKERYNINVKYMVFCRQFQTRRKRHASRAVSNAFDRGQEAANRIGRGSQGLTEEANTISPLIAHTILNHISMTIAVSQ